MCEETPETVLFLEFEALKRACIQCGKEIPPPIIETGVPPQMCLECRVRFLRELETIPIS